ncbi:MAG TPA: P-loop NTPase fold protein [Acidimicrobiales bacterium]|nr:P-loop NTPase fold protein [Acidimicrobiales bacterium]
MAGPRGQLSASSKTALRNAWASAVLRSGATDPWSVTADSFDLLVGILTAHPRDSEPRQLLEHFGVPPGAVFAPAGLRPFGLDDLVAAIRDLPADDPTPRGDVATILERAERAESRSEPDFVTLADVFGALLATDTPAALSVRGQLNQRGVTVGELVSSYPAYLKDGEDYDAFLRKRHPWPKPVSLPTYRPDRARPRKPRPEAPPPTDLVGIQAEVEAFAYLIASRTLSPPLAVGLFGDWGSGKSYFLRSLQARIDALVTNPVTRSRPQRDLPFYKAVVQIEFNAWQYVGGDLWASLLDHLFRNLRLGDEDEDLMAQRQTFWVRRIREAGEEREALARRRAELEAEAQSAAAQVEQRRRQRDEAVQDLTRRQRESAEGTWVPSPALQKQVRDAADRAGVSTVATEAAGLAAALSEAGDVLRRSGPLLAGVRRSRLVTPIALIVLVPAVSFVLAHYDVPAVSNVATTVAAAFAGLTAFVKKATGDLQHELDAIDAAREALAKEAEQRRQALDDSVAEAQQRLDTVTDELAEAASREQAIAGRMAESEEALAATTPARVLHDFITERLGSDDYRKHLGVPALVRRDLERLSGVIEEENERLRRPDGDEPTVGDAEAINRIVLYIDDLDRCPTPLVIQVLQAVHLLLAFPLFVVVVAVDTRWLAGSLREHYGALLTDGADPDDYVEKIFQIPYWVRPLSPEMRLRMARGLLADQPAAGGSAPAVDGGRFDKDEKATGQEAELQHVVASLFDTDGGDPPWLAAAALTVGEAELEFVDQVAPLLGTTPRSVQRFVNVYQLVKSISRHGPAPAPSRVPEHERLLLLLAIATGLPGVADALLDGAPPAAGAPATLRARVQALKRTGAAPAGEVDRLTEWLAAHPRLAALKMSDLADLADVARRFSFHLGGRLVAEEAAP